MAIIVKKGELAKINKGMSQKRLAERCTYVEKEFPKNNLSKKVEETLNKIFSSMK